MINISVYSGKCDCFDVLIMIREVTDFTKVKIYANINDLIPLRIDCKKDLIPYYPYLEVMGTGDKDGNVCIWLSQRSFVDIEEEESLTWKLNTVLRYWRKCKRKHEPFDKEEALKLISYFEDDAGYRKEIVDRVAEHGKKATIDGLHTPMHDQYREELYKTMVEAGYTDDEAYRWCFGWDRWIERAKDEKHD